MTKGVYLDHAATTPLDRRVLEAMEPYLSESFGNASSVHSLGRRARFAIEESRERIAGLIGAEPGEIIFTSGGTEANNTALRGIGGGILTCAAEHESILRAAERLEAEGRRVLVAEPDGTGVVGSEAFEEHLAVDGLIPDGRKREIQDMRGGRPRTQRRGDDHPLRDRVQDAAVQAVAHAARVIATFVGRFDR